jgi:hypothetical protein
MRPLLCSISYMNFRESPEDELRHNGVLRSSICPIAPLLEAQDAPEGKCTPRGFIGKSSVVVWGAYGCWYGAMLQLPNHLRHQGLCVPS